MIVRYAYLAGKDLGYLWFKEQNTFLRALWACTRVTNKLEGHRPEGFRSPKGKPTKWTSMLNNGPYQTGDIYLINSNDDIDNMFE